MTDHIVLIGSMGAGKSETGVAVAEALGLPFVDSDAQIEERLGMTGRAFADANDVDTLHELEATVLLDALRSDSGSVIAAAASTIENPTVRAELARALVVRLTLPAAETLRRQSTGSHRRPMSATELGELNEKRRPLEESVARITLSAEQPTSVLVDEILAFVDGQSNGPGV